MNGTTGQRAGDDGEGVLDSVDFDEIVKAFDPA